MSSVAQIEANRRNAENSTGPRTEDGKDASRANGVRHGLRSEKVLVIGEDAAEYVEHRRGMLRRLRPADTLERGLAERIISLGWRLKRAEWIEAAYLNRDLGRAHYIARHELPEGQRQAWDQEPDSILVGIVLGESMSGPANSYETLRRYERTAERAYYAALREFRAARKEREQGTGNGEREDAEKGEGRGEKEDAGRAEERRGEGRGETRRGMDPATFSREPQASAQPSEGDPSEAAADAQSEDFCRANPIWDEAVDERNSFYQGTLRKREAESGASGRAQQDPAPAPDAAPEREAPALERYDLGREDVQSLMRRYLSKGYWRLAKMVMYNGHSAPPELEEWIAEMRRRRQAGKEVLPFEDWRDDRRAPPAQQQPRRDAGDARDGKNETKEGTEDEKKTEGGMSNIEQRNLE